MGFQDLDPLGCSLGRLASLFARTFGVGNGILQCRYLSFQGFDSPSRGFGFSASLLSQSLGLRDSFLQRTNISFQSLDTRDCGPGFMALLFAQGFGAGDSVLQRSDLSFQGLDRTAFARIGCAKRMVIRLYMGAEARLESRGEIGVGQASCPPYGRMTTASHG